MATQLEILTKTLKQSEPSDEAATIIPARPTNFETRNTGTTFAFLPRTLSDGRIDIEFDLEFVRFLGFFDYGPTIQSEADDPIDSKIQQPIFETSKWSSSTTIESGSWIVVTGLGAKGTSGAPDLKEGATPRFDASNDLDDSEFLVLIRVSRADAP